jgi:alpha-glucosidase
LWSWLAPAGIDRYWGQPVEHARYSGTAMAATMDAFTALIPWRSRVHSLNLLDSHDTPRLLSVVGKQLFLVAVGMMLTMPGLPMIFAGDEIGTEGSGLEDSRRPFRWDQNTWDREIRDLYGDLLAIRARHPALSSGGFRWLHTDNDVVVYERAHPEETLIIQASRAPHPSVACPLTGIAVHAETDLSADGSLPTSGPAFRIWLASAPPRQPTRHFGTTATGPLLGE